jgi:hypothetical protein
MQQSVSENLKSCYSLRSISDDENPPWHALPEIPPPHAGPPLASRGVDARTAPQIVEATTEQRARGRKSHSLALLNARLRERDVAVQRRDRGEGGEPFLFSSVQIIENKRNRVGIPPNNPPTFRGIRCNGGDRLAEPKGVVTPRPSWASFAGNRRAGGCGDVKFSYLQTLEKARNGEGIWPTVALRAGEPASDSSGVIPQGRPCWYELATTAGRQLSFAIERGSCLDHGSSPRMAKKPFPPTRDRASLPREEAASYRVRSSL